MATDGNSTATDGRGFATENNTAVADACKPMFREYERLGWVVFPCRPKEKVPAGKWRDAGPATADQMYLWVSQGYNLALSLSASGLAAVDLDLYKGQPPHIQRLVEHASIRAKTPRGGFHYLFRCSDLNIKDISENAWDLKHNGYILIAPSYVEYKTGQKGRYQWEKFQPDHLQPLPQLIVEKAAGQPAAANSATPAAEEDDPLRSLLPRILTGGFTPGRHNEELRDFARTLYRVSFSGNPELVADMVRAIALAQDARDPTPQGDQALRTIDSAIQYEQNRLKQKAEALQARSSVAVSDDFKVESFASLLEREDDLEIRYWYEGLLPQNSIFYLAGPPGVYKTWFLLDLAVSLSNGVSFMGIPLISNVGQVPVLVVQQEDYIGLLLQRLKIISDARIPFELEQVGDMTFRLRHAGLAPLYFHTQRQLSFESKRSFEQLGEQIQRYKIRQCLIDPLYTLASGTENYYNDVAQRFQWLRSLRDTYEVGFIIAHHTRKASGGSRPQDNFWGGRLLQAAFEGGMIMAPTDEPGVVRLITSSKFMPAQPARLIAFFINTDTGEYRTEITEADEQLDAGVQAVLDALNTFGAAGATPAMIEDETGVNRGTVYKKLQNLQKDGLVVKRGKKWYSVGHIHIDDALT